jgi:hypothetical protein
MAYIGIEVDLSEFDDDELLQEFENRDIELPLSEDDAKTLTNAWIAGRNGDKEKAYALLWEYALNKLGKVV